MFWNNLGQRKQSMESVFDAIVNVLVKKIVLVKRTVLWYKWHVFVFVLDPKPLGLQDFRIKDDQITASDSYHNVSSRLPRYARLNSNSFWAGLDRRYRWLQVDFLSTVGVTKIQTQGGGGYWVKHLSVMTGRDEDSLVPIMESGSEKVSKSCDITNTAAKPLPKSHSKPHLLRTNVDFQS